METTLDAQIARLQALALEGEPQPLPPPSDAASGPQGPPAPLILTPGTFEDIRDLEFLSLHRDTYLPSEEFSYPRRGPRSNCGAPFKAVKACGCGCAAVRDHCDDKNCEHNYCANVNRRRRGRDIEEKFEAGRRGRDITYGVFTVPPRRRQAAGEKVKLRPRRKKDGTLEPREVFRWQLWLSELIEGLKGCIGLEYCVERSDPAGEDRERWHPHLNLLWVTHDGRGYVDDDMLEAIKSEWKRIIGVREEEPVSVHVRFVTDRARPGHPIQALNYSPGKRRGHLYSYMGRTWPGWEEEFPYHCRVKWFGRPAPAPDRTPDPCCEKCGLEVAVVRTGSEEAAAELAAKGYAFVLATARDKLDALRKFAERRKRVPFRGLLGYVAQVMEEEAKR